MIKVKRYSDLKNIKGQKYMETLEVSNEDLLCRLAEMSTVTFSTRESHVVDTEIDADDIEFDTLNDIINKNTSVTVYYLNGGMNTKIIDEYDPIFIRNRIISQLHKIKKLSFSRIETIITGYFITI